MRGEANGLTGLRLIGSEELHELEPHASGLQALLVPSTGVTDYALVCEKYAQLIVASGGTVRTSVAVTGIQRSAQEIVVETNTGAMATSAVINCAGLYSDRIARMAGDDPGIMIVPFRGEYYDLTPERSSLVAGADLSGTGPALSIPGRAFHTPHNGQGRRGPECSACPGAGRIPAQRHQRPGSGVIAGVPQILAYGWQALAECAGRMASLLLKARVCPSPATTTA